MLWAMPGPELGFASSGCSATPDPNISPQLRMPVKLGPERTPERMSDRMQDRMPDRMQDRECQNICQVDRRKECNVRTHVECHKEY